MSSLFPARYQQFLTLLRRAREEAGIPQEELARRFGDFTQAEVSRVERGVRRLDVVEAVHWCQALGLSPSAFVDALVERFDAQRLAHRGTHRSPIPTPARRNAPVMYRDGEQTWSGRGRKPLWLKLAEARGVDIEQFKIPAPKRRSSK